MTLLRSLLQAMTIPDGQDNEEIVVELTDEEDPIVILTSQHVYHILICISLYQKTPYSLRLQGDKRKHRRKVSC